MCSPSRHQVFVVVNITHVLGLTCPSVVNHQQNWSSLPVHPPAWAVKPPWLCCERENITWLVPSESKSFIVARVSSCKARTESELTHVTHPWSFFPRSHSLCLQS